MQKKLKLKAFTIKQKYLRKLELNNANQLEKKSNTPKNIREKKQGIPSKKKSLELGWTWIDLNE